MMNMKNQYSITLGFNKVQYKELLQIAVDQGYDSLYAFLKADIVANHGLTATRLHGKETMSLKEQLKEIKKSEGKI